jgi:ABC-2 type transport system permease protein
MSPLGAVFYRDFRQRMTNVSLLFWDLLAPLAYLALFGIGFEAMMGQAPVITGQPFGYTAFLVPGVLAMVAFGIGLNTSWGFFMDKESGIVYELLTYPITRPQILLGKVGFNVLLALIGAVLVIALGSVALSVPVQWASLPLMILVTVISTAAWFFMFTAWAISIDRMDAYNAVASALYILLMFFSSMFYPLTGVPAWFRVVSYLNPLTWQVDLLRFSLLGLGDRGMLLLEGAALTVFTAMCMTFAVRALNRVA